MRLDERVNAMRAEAERRGVPVVASSHQGVAKTRIQRVLGALSLEGDDIIDAVYALLDDTRDSWFAAPPPGARFSDGATTAHVGCHIGILQRGGGKLDREGRDYWIKPLRDIGAVEACSLVPEQRTFLSGHPVPKSPNNCYRLDRGFVHLLKCHEEVLPTYIADWANEESTRQRLKLQASVAGETSARVRSSHGELIEACIQVYAREFLPGFELLYTDSSDGDRVSGSDKSSLLRAGLSLGLGDPMPDAIFWNPETGGLWIVEAVTSDGEVDLHKLQGVEAWATRHGRLLEGATTAYPNWRVAATRQSRHRNLAPGSYLWILEDPGRQFYVGEARVRSEGRSTR